MKNLKKGMFAFSLALSMALAVALNFVSFNASALQEPGKIPCHSSSSAQAGNKHTSCATCQEVDGLGSDAGQCRPNND